MHHDRARQSVRERLREQEDDDQERRWPLQRPGAPAICPEPEVAPPLLVEAEGAEHDQPCRRRRSRPTSASMCPVAVRDAARGIEEAQPEGQVVRERDEQCVGGDLDHPVPVDRVLQPLHARRGHSSRVATMPPPHDRCYILDHRGGRPTSCRRRHQSHRRRRARRRLRADARSRAPASRSRARRPCCSPASTSPRANLTLFGIVAAGVLGNLVGSWIAYAVGYYGRLELLEQNRLIHINRRHLEWADDWFERYGDATVFFSQDAADHPDLHLAARPGSRGCRSGASRVYTLAGLHPLGPGAGADRQGASATTGMSGRTICTTSTTRCSPRSWPRSSTLIRRRRAPGTRRSGSRRSAEAERATRRHDHAVAGRSPSASSRGRPSCCRSPARPTSSSSPGSPAGTGTTVDPSCARASRSRSTRARRRRC